MKVDLIHELNDNSLISDMEENTFYKYDTSSDFYSDYILLRKLNDKIICCNINNEEGNINYLKSDDNESIQYLVIDIDDVEKDNMDCLYTELFYNYPNFMELYSTEKMKDSFFAFDCKKELDQISIDDMQNEVSKKVFPIEIKETLSKIVYIRENSVSDAIDKVRNLRNEEKIVLDYDDFTDYNIAEYEDKSISQFTTLEQKLYDYKTSLFKKEDLDYYLAFSDIYSFDSSATDEEVLTITDACYEAMKEDYNNYSITKFTSFIVTNYYADCLSLDEIKNANPKDIISDAINYYADCFSIDELKNVASRDVVSDTINDTSYYLKNYEEKLER